MTALRSGSATDVGRVRASNQDVALEDPDLYAVADGMGGHAGGEVAARVAIETLKTSFQRQPTVEGLRRAVAEANRAVWRQGQTESGLRGMGTTLTATALVRDPGGRQVIALANVGDSRAYVYSHEQVIQITADHSLAEEKVRQGEMTEAEARMHPHRHILTRALGVASDVDVDLWELHLREGDRILLCSDGLTNEIGDERIGQILAQVVDPEEAAKALVTAAVEHGGNDNVTVVVVDVVSADESAPRDVRDRAHRPSGSDGRDPTADAGAADATAGADSAGADSAGADRAAGPAAPDAGEAAALSGTGIADAASPPGADPSAGVTASGGGSAEELDTHAVPVAGVITARRPSEGAVRAGGGIGPASGTAPRNNTGTAPRNDTGTAPRNDTGTAPRNDTGSANRIDRGTVHRNAREAPAAADASNLSAPRERAAPGFGAQAAELRRLRPSRKERRRHRRMAGIPRLVTFRVVLFLVLLAAIVGAGYELVRWYAMDDWYVGIDNQHLAVYQGHPGGFLWFKPKLVDETSVTTSEVLPFNLTTLKSHPQKPSLGAARRYVRNLYQEYEATQQGSTSSTSPSISTTTTTAATKTVFV